MAEGYALPGLAVARRGAPLLICFARLEFVQ